MRHPPRVFRHGARKAPRIKWPTTLLNLCSGDNVSSGELPRHPGLGRRSPSLPQCGALSQYSLRRDPIFSGTVNWSLIREQYDLFMQLSVAIPSSAPAPSAVLARIHSYSARNRFGLALQEFGKAVRTTFLLDWIMDDSIRRLVHKCTTKIERHHRFAKHLAFGEHGLFAID
jgi:hypothetical protein